jgi:FkbM family methyltransferase
MITDRAYRSLSRVPVAQRLFRRIVTRLPRRRRIVTYAGSKLEIDPTELHGFYLYYEREYDAPVFAILKDRLPEFSRALDIGANIGIYSVFLARYVSQVDAFEPENSVLSRLRGNLARNQVHNVRIHECCVGDIDGTVTFSSPPSTNQGLGEISINGSCGRSVPSVTLNSFLADVPQQPLFIKMDIEGAEWLAWQGGAERLAAWSSPVLVVMETHDGVVKYGGDLTRLAALIRSLGFTVEGITAEGRLNSSDAMGCRHWICERS